MARLVVTNFTVSLDGYGAGPDQSEDNPLGVGGEQLHGWMVRTRTFAAYAGTGGDVTGLDDEMAQRNLARAGATIMGRNMFGPVRGPWPDDEWRGWWGDEPPYHNDVFVLTHHARDPLPMAGGTTFHFVTGGIREAYDRAMEVAGDEDVRLSGGVATIREYLAAGLVDELQLAISPLLLGQGERLFGDLDLPAYECADIASSDLATHFRLVRADLGSCRDGATAAAARPSTARD